MKCDDLQERWFEAYPVEGDQIIPTKVYGKKDADDAIAELKCELKDVTDDRNEFKQLYIEQTEKLCIEKTNAAKLEEVYAYQSDEIESLFGNANGNSYYLKSEADKVIAKLEEKLDTTEKLLNKALDCFCAITKNDKLIVYPKAEGGESVEINIKRCPMCGRDFGQQEKQHHTPDKIICPIFSKMDLQRWLKSKKSE